MRRISFFLVILLCILIKTNAQEQESTKNVFLQTGITNNGYNATVGFEKLFGSGKNNGLNLALNFHRLNHSIEAVQAIQEEKSTFLNLSYRRYFMPNNLSHFNPYAGLGVLGGYQHFMGADYINGGFQPEINFLYGGSSQVGVEYNFNRFSIFAEGAYLFTGYHYVRGNMGIKYHF